MRKHLSLVGGLLVLDSLSLTS